MRDGMREAGRRRVGSVYLICARWRGYWLSDHGRGVGGVEEGRWLGQHGMQHGSRED